MNSIHRTLLVTLFVLLLNTSVEAADRNQERSVLQSSEFTHSDQQRANLWRLSKEEWQQYKTLMEGVRGSISPHTISPIEVLGIHSSDESERRRYAELWAQIMFEDTERVLAFDRAYQAAFHLLYPNVQAIDTSQILPQRENTELMPGDRILLFTSNQCDTESCDRILRRALTVAQISPGVGVDIYMVGNHWTDETIRAYAREQGISETQVKDQKVTLNHDNGLMARIRKGNNPRLPFIARKRGQQLDIIIGL